jgi:hypothetical protein
VSDGAAEIADAAVGQLDLRRRSRGDGAPSLTAALQERAAVVLADGGHQRAVVTERLVDPTGRIELREREVVSVVPCYQDPLVGVYADAARTAAWVACRAAARSSASGTPR